MQFWAANLAAMISTVGAKTTDWVQAWVVEATVGAESFLSNLKSEKINKRIY